MLKSSRSFFCAATAASAAATPTVPPTPAAPATPSAPPTTNDDANNSKKSKAVYTTTAWKEVKMHSWMQRQIISKEASSLSPSIMFHGDKCGPQPVLLLPALAYSNQKLISPAGSTKDAAASYSTFASALNHAHGVLSLPYANLDVAKIAAAADRRKAVARQLRGDCTARADIVPSTQLAVDDANANPDCDDGFITAYCHDLVIKLNQLNVDWVTCVGEAFGALVAAKLALLYPERVGSVFLFNTPLVSSVTLEYAKHLSQARKAVVDINVPQGLLDFTISEELVNSKFPTALSSMMPTGGDDEAAVKALFATARTDEERLQGILADGDVNGWMTHDQLCLLRHPMCIAVPSDKAAAENELSCASALPAHEQCFNVRRVAKVKSAPADAKSLMMSSSGGGKKKPEAGDAVIEETADLVSQWIKRYDADEIVKRRWQQAKGDMSKMVFGGGEKKPGDEDAAGSASAGAGGGGGSGGKGEGKGGKKGGKKGGDISKKGEKKEPKEPKEPK